MQLRKKRTTTRRAVKRRAEQSSLFGEILDWMLAPLMFLWPLSVAVTHLVANHIANQPYDRALQEQAHAIARLVHISPNGQAVSEVTNQVRALLQGDADDRFYYQIRGTRGEVVAGADFLPPPQLAPQEEPNQVMFRDLMWQGEEIRIASVLINQATKPGDIPVMVQVGETRNKRALLAGRIVSGVLLPQFVFIPIAVVLVYLGLGRGIAPLARLRRMIQRRRPGDLSVISIRGLPDEVVPMIDAFNELMARLERYQSAQQRFIADAAHQMRTPLAGLKMQVEIALSEGDEQQMRRSLQQINESTDRTAHLINQLLVLARTEATSEVTHAFEVVDLEKLLPSIIEEFFPRALAKRIDLGLETTHWPLLISGNPILLRELFKNLIDNALKYTPNGGVVTVRLLATEEAVVEVEDNGPGIPPEERDHVFERFYRVLGNAAMGSGLGLSIVSEIVQMHQAHIEVDAPKQHTGCVMRVRLRRIQSLQADPETVVGD